MRRPTPPLVLALALTAVLSLPGSAQAGRGSEFAGASAMVLAGLQIPAAVFEFVGAARLTPQLALYDGDEVFLLKARRARTGNVVSGAIHLVKMGAWMGGGLAAVDRGADALPPAILLCGALDMTNAIIGLTMGLELLTGKASAGVKGTPMGDAATWSGVIHLVFGTISAIVTLPEIFAGLLGVVAMTERSAARDRWLARRVVVVPGPGTVSLVGRF